MKTPRRRSLLTVLGVSAAAAAALPVVAATVTGAPAPPDLFAQPAGAPKAQLYKDGRLLIRFDGYIPNAAGAGPLEIRASDPNAQGVMQNVGQYAVPVNDPGDGNALLSTGRAPRVQFESADDHNHYHLKNAAEYTLRTPDGAGQVALAQKTEAGFCLEDSQDLAGNPKDGAYSASAANVGGNNFCWQNDQRTGPVLIMGISPGYRDVYGEWLTYQWVDVSTVQPGDYKLASRVDPDNVIQESNEANNGYALRDAVVPGYVATSKTVGLAPSVPVALDATRFTATDYPTDGNGEAAGNPGARRFKIVAGPRHGSLNVPVGQELPGNASVVYTPAPGSNLTDAFQYVAYYRATADDGVNRMYPANPAPATVTVAGATPAVAINGAPASVIAGTSVQLSAAVVNAPSGVTWSATGGTVSPTGLFTAPATPGDVTVRATSNDEPSVSAAATIAVVAAPPKKPAGSSLLTAGNKRLSQLRITRSKRLVVAKVAVGAKAGRVAFTASYGRRVLARHTYRVGARKTVTFKVRLRPGINPKKVRITAKFTRGKITAVRRSFVR